MRVLILEFREMGAGSHQNQGALTKDGERFDLVGGANAVNPVVVGSSPTEGVI